MFVSSYRLSDEHRDRRKGTRPSTLLHRGVRYGAQAKAACVMQNGERGGRVKRGCRGLARSVWCPPASAGGRAGAPRPFLPRHRRLSRSLSLPPSLRPSLDHLCGVVGLRRSRQVVDVGAARGSLARSLEADSKGDERGRGRPRVRPPPPRPSRVCCVAAAAEVGNAGGGRREEGGREGEEMSFVVAGAACCKNTGEASGGAVAPPLHLHASPAHAAAAPLPHSPTLKREVASMCETK